ncbi:zinc finger, C2H2, partial [Tanacetum coccineum]
LIEEDNISNNAHSSSEHMEADNHMSNGASEYSPSTTHSVAIVKKSVVQERSAADDEDMDPTESMQKKGLTIVSNYGEKGSVQKVLLSANDDGKNFATVSLRHVFISEKDPLKLWSNMIDHVKFIENFPFTIQGIVQDIVINPHAFPSQQTLGQLLEAALGKGIGLGGSMEYATPFSTPTFAFTGVDFLDGETREFMIGTDDAYGYKCKTCKKRFKSFQALGGHQGIHRKIKPNEDNFDDMCMLRLNIIPTGSFHRSKMCTKVFETGQMLGGHMRKHRDKKVELWRKKQSKENGESSLVLTMEELERRQAELDERMRVRRDLILAAKEFRLWF